MDYFAWFPRDVRICSIFFFTLYTNSCIHKQQHTKPKYLNNRAPEYSYNMNVDLSIFGSLLKLDPHRNGMAPDMDGDVREIGPMKSHIQHNRMQIFIIPFIRLFPFIDASKSDPIHDSASAPFFANSISHSSNQE